MKGRGQELIYDCKYLGGNLGGKHEIQSWMILRRSEDSGLEAAQIYCQSSCRRSMESMESMERK